MKYKKNKDEILLILISLGVVIYFAILIAPSFDSDNLEDFLVSAKRCIENPLKLNWSKSTLKTLLFCFLGYALGVIYFITMPKATRQGEEHGSSKLKNPRNVNRKITDRTYNKNRILTQNVRISVTGKKIKQNLNTLIIGGPGSGKSFFTLVPNILQANTSMVITDPSKELMKATGSYLERKGYKVKALDLEDFSSSFRYNFFKYIESVADIKRTVDLIFAATKKSGEKISHSDPMWENMAKDYISAMIALLVDSGTDDEKNIDTLNYIMQEDFLQEDENGNRVKTPIMALFEKMANENPDNFASRSYKSATDGAVITIRGVKSTARARLGMFLIPEVSNLLSSDEMDLDNIGSEKTALFLIVPSEDTSFNFVISILYQQLFQSLYRQARQNDNNKLKVPIQIFIDEMANFVMPDNFINYLTTSRKHDISYMMFFQEMGQIKEMFKDLKDTLIGACDSILYLGRSGYETEKAISSWIGYETVNVMSYNRSYGRNANYSKNMQPTKREVLSPDEIDSKIKEEEALLYVKGLGFCIDKKNDPKSHPAYKETSFVTGNIYKVGGEELSGYSLQSNSIKETGDEVVIELDLDNMIRQHKLDLDKLDREVQTLK